ncbi:MAG: AZL_007920/MXAN_0976 family protein [Phormidesmis priestleyi Ana]|uniref:AZL_007920/MXAN_0976 family protein n=1 Tax=Phormidesmis priestleyi Ana TaxID=1666911 RepID=A0A0P7YNZ0_9CYAN|nr:MAG: AZL_007920/MXAN_0976 family protein [Phormidesmis priestleyi Ana]
MKPVSFAAISLLTITSWIGGLLLSPSQAAETQAVTLNFEGMVGNQPFSCTESYQLGTAETMAVPTDFRLYLSDLALIDARGNAVPITLEQDGKWQYENVALLDFEDRTGTCANGTPETRTEVMGIVPAGDYQGVQFTVGVPFDLNHDDATLAPSPLNLTSLWWNWRGGYKFLRVDLETRHMNAELPVQPKTEGHFEQGSSTTHTSDIGHGAGATGFAIHLGSTGCQAEGENLQPTSCVNPNRADIVLSDLNPISDIIVVDLAALVQFNNLSTNMPNTPAGCMSAPEDADCMGIMHSLGISFNGEPSPGQTVFRSERRNE